jgi:acetyl-CoA C-acetyltransferase
MSSNLTKLTPTRLRQPSFARPVFAVAGGLSLPGKARPDTVVEEQVCEAVRMMFRDNDLRLHSPKDLKHFNGFVQSAYFSDHFESQVLMSSIVQDAIGWNPMAGWRIEAGGATGGCAVQAAAMAVASGVYDYAIVLGWEKMSMVSTAQGTEFIALASDTDFDFEQGGNYTGYYASIAHEHINRYGTTRSQMAKVAVKNRNQAQFNPFAQTSFKNPFRTSSGSGFITTQDVLSDDRPGCSPIRPIDCSQMSDAASALLICSDELAHQLSDHPIRLAGIGAGTDTMRTGDRIKKKGAILEEGLFLPGRNLLLPHENTPEIIDWYKTVQFPSANSFLAGRVAAIEAYRMAGISDPLKQIKWFEMHDAFSSAELQAVEDFGLSPFGKGGKFIDTGDFDSSAGRFKSDFPSFGYNPTDRVHLSISGGLIGARHGIGDTGVFQNVDTIWRLQGKIKKFYGHDAFQPPVKGGTKAADHSHAGTGSIVAISIWERPEGLREFEVDNSKPSVAEIVYERILKEREIAQKGTGIRKPSPPTNQSDLLPPTHPEYKVRYKNSAGASIVHTPYKIDYYKTRGRVSPFFDGLGEGKCLVTYCSKHGVYNPPIATCRHSDCLDDISENWTDLAFAVGRVQTWTSMHFTGPSFNGDLPFLNVLVEYPENYGLRDAVTGAKLENQTVNTSVMSRLILPSWLTEKDIFAGMPVRPEFNTKSPTGRVTDMWFAPAFDEVEWNSKIKHEIADNLRASNSKHFMS